MSGAAQQGVAPDELGRLAFGLPLALAVERRYVARLMDNVGKWRLLRSAIVASVGLAAGVLTFLQLVVLAIATSHPGLAGDVMIRQRIVATLCAGVAALIVVASSFRRRLPGVPLTVVLMSACASLAGGVVLVWRDSRQWDPASMALTGLTAALLIVAAGFSVPAG